MRKNHPTLGGGTKELFLDSAYFRKNLNRPIGCACAPNHLGKNMLYVFDGSQASI